MTSHIRFAKNPAHADFRIDFAAVAALIGHPKPLTDLIMPDDRPQSSAPLAEIAHGPSAFERFLDQNQKLLVVFAILLVIAAAGLVVYRGVEKSRQQTAGAALFEAGELAELNQVIEDHAGTRAAGSAAILLADAQWKDGRQDDAIATLRQFIETHPDHPALATARASLGSKLASQGKNDAAATAFQQVVDDPRSRYLAPYALVSLGDLSQVAGDADKAETLYSRARADYPDSGFASTAGERLAMLRATMPVEVDPPPAPEPAETGTPAATGAGTLPGVPSAIAAPTLDEPAPSPEATEPAESSDPADESDAAPQP
ncbi:MAG TPA: tetratricopeptide repeat protein [Luteolibacter sp.]|nr:tetratricopeptide repeat protein [Luteolibacter sp.]